ncbi:ribbon-helix-helix protein, CopG family [Natronorubrum sp. DTA28]|uniref:ribbon-helix-helix protein, CopG family n=1 Tax=Natronorubrum sp. DTA28 TaxID=3447019 RepID=UPI003F82EEEB
MGTNDETVVQTALSADEYERFRSIAEREGKTLKEALRAAATEYVTEREQPDPDDPFFSYDPPRDDGEAVTATKTDDYLYGDE